MYLLADKEIGGCHGLPFAVEDEENKRERGDT